MILIDYCEIKSDDVDALTEACICDGYGFGKITRTVRTEWPQLGIRAAIETVCASLKRIGRHATAVGASARRTLDQWTADHPGIKL
jgi:hypothetical protein